MFGLSLASELLLVRDSACLVLEVKHFCGLLSFFFYSDVSKRDCLLDF